MNLTAFQHSAFLQALGWAIANSVWQAGIFWGLYHILVSSYSNASSRLKNNLSTIFLFSTFLWFVITFVNKFIYLQNKLPVTIAKQPGFSTDFYPRSGGPSLQNLILSAGIVLPYLSIAYLLLLLFFMVKLINSYRNTIFIRHHGLQKPGVDWRLFVEKVSGYMNITRKIKLWFSQHVDVPATIGFLKPVILIPVASLNRLTADQLEAIILHELSHIKRNDYLINLLVSLIDTVLFFNPFIVLLSNIVKKERENCCDDFVLQYQYDRHSYASALLSLEKCRIQIQNFPLALAATSGKKQLLLRVKRIMEVKNRTNSLNYGQKLFALLLITGIICSIAWLSPVRRSSQSYTSKRLKKESIAVRRKMNQKKNIFLRSKNETTANPFLSSKTIKGKRITLINTYKKNNSSEKKDEALFTWSPQENEIENNRQLTEASDNSVAIVPNTHWNPGTFKEGKNLFFLPKFPVPDFKFLQDLNFFIDINKLEAEVEKNSHLFASVEWDKVQQEIVENLAKIKVANSKINTEKNKIASTIINNRLKEKREKNSQNKFRFNFISDRTDNTSTRSIETELNDSLFINSSSNDNDGIFYTRSDKNNFPTPLPPSEKGHKTTTASLQFYNHLRINSDAPERPAASVYSANREKLPSKQLMQICYKDGSITINGKRISSFQLKKYQTQEIIKKLLLDCNNHIVGMQTED